MHGFLKYLQAVTLLALRKLKQLKVHLLLNPQFTLLKSTLHLEDCNCSREEAIAKQTGLNLMLSSEETFRQSRYTVCHITPP